MARHEDSLASEILIYIRDCPGCTGADVRKQFCPDGSEKEKLYVSQTLGRLRREKVIANLGKGGPHSKYYPLCLHCGLPLNFGIPEPSEIAIKYEKYHPLPTEPRLYHIHSGANACDCRAKLHPDDKPGNRYGEPERVLAMP